MGEPAPKPTEDSRVESADSSGPLSRNPRLMLPLTGVFILVLDWLLFSQNAISLGLATPLVVIVGFLLGAAGTFFLQRRLGHDSLPLATLKALIAGVAIGVPWPIVGTAVGGWILLASGLPAILGSNGARRD